MRSRHERIRFVDTLCALCVYPFRYCCFFYAVLGIFMSFFCCCCIFGPLLSVCLLIHRQNDGWTEWRARQGESIYKYNIRHLMFALQTHIHWQYIDVNRRRPSHMHETKSMSRMYFVIYIHSINVCVGSHTGGGSARKKHRIFRSVVFGIARSIHYYTK